MKPKRILIFFLMAVCWTVIPASAARLGDLRAHARFLTDRMAYELNLNNRQYNDVFEINFDFFYNVDPYVDRMSYGDPYALDMYYRYLDERNDDLRWVLSRSKYRRFMTIKHFFLPIYAVNRVCYVRIYNVYPNRTHFYFGRPSHYYSYHGGHCRHHLGGVSFYKTNYRKHYTHSVYTGNYQSIRTQSRRLDFPNVHRHSASARTETVGNLSDRLHSSNESSVSRPVRHSTVIRGSSSSHDSKSESSSVRPVRRENVTRHSSGSGVRTRTSHHSAARQQSTSVRSSRHSANSTRSEKTERRTARER